MDLGRSTLIMSAGVPYMSSTIPHPATISSDTGAARNLSPVPFTSGATPSSGVSGFKRSTDTGMWTVSSSRFTSSSSR